MAKIRVNELKNLVEEIIKLGDGSIENQKNACKLIREKIFVNETCVDGSVIPKLLPLIVRLITSEDETLQRKSAYFIQVITRTSDHLRTDVENAQLVIDHLATENLLKCLSSSQNEAVILQCLKSLVNISAYFPDKIFKKNVLPSITECVKLKNATVSYHATIILKNISTDVSQNLQIIIQSNAGMTFKNLLESSPRNSKIFDVSLIALVNIMYQNEESCQYVLDLGILNLMENVFEHLFGNIKPPLKKRKSVFKAGTDANAIQESIKLSSIQFILNATHFNQKQIDMVLEKNFMPFIFKYIDSKAFDKIKNYSVSVIDNIIEKKPSFIPNLINDGIISLLYNNLGTQNFELIETVLTTLYNFIKYSGYDETVRQKIIECGNPEKLQNLLQREDLKEFPKDIYNFVVGNVKFEPGIIEKVETREEEEVSALAAVNENIIEFNELTDVEVQVKTETNESNEQNEDEQGPVAENENVIENDFDDSHVEVQRLPTDVQNLVVGNVKVEPDIIEKVEANEEEEVRAAENVLQFDELTNNDFDDINVETQEILTTATNNEQNHRSSTDVENATRGGKRTWNASELGEPHSKRCRSDRSSNENVSNNSSTDQRPPIVLDFHEIDHNSENSITPLFLDQSEGLPKATNSVEINRDQNAFAPVKYYTPPEAVIDDFCKKLVLKFDRKKFLEFCSKIDFETITLDSKPKKFYRSNDKSGFGCFSLFFTGTEAYADKIRNKVVQNFIDSENSKEKLKQIVKSTSMTSEHCETIVRWLKCKIMVFSDENGWEKYGDWGSEDKYVPIFVLKKIQSGNDNIFEIVLSFD